MVTNEHESTGRNGVFDDVLIEIEDLPNVVAALDSGAEVVPVPSRNGNSAKTERIPARPSGDALSAITVYRDPEDVRTIFNLTRILMVLAVIIVGSGVANIYQYYRRLIPSLLAEVGSCFGRSRSSSTRTSIQTRATSAYRDRVGSEGSRTPRS